MARFLFYTDIHLAAKCPRHRVDNYANSIVEKVSEIYEIASVEGCDFVIFGGDFFNSHMVFSYELINNVMDVICNSDLQTYSIVGQHDLKGYNPETLKSSTLAFVTKYCDKFEILNGVKELGDVALYHSHVWQDVRVDCAQEVGKGKVNVLIAHHLLSKDLDVFEVVKTSTIEPCNFDLVLSGDLHTGFETHSVGNTVFANPGSIARQSISDKSRHPMVLVVDVELGVVPVVKEILLSRAKDGEEVFGVDVIEGLREMATMDGGEFVDQVRALEMEAVDVFDLVEKLSVEKGVRKEVVSYILSKKTDGG